MRQIGKQKRAKLVNCIKKFGSFKKNNYLCTIILIENREYHFGF